MGSMLIAVTGPKRSGKNTLCDILSAEYGFTLIGFADTLKEMAIAIDPIVTGGGEGLASIVAHESWDVAKERYPEVRRFLQRLGTEGVREHLGQSTWIESWARKIAMTPGHVAVPDLRFVNEAAAVRSAGGQVWRVNRPGFTGSGHISETETDQIIPDEVIANDHAGLDGSLNRTIAQIIGRLGRTQLAVAS